MGKGKAGQGRGRGRKRCSACASWKPRTAFDRRAAARDGLDSWCKNCRRAYVRKWIATNRQRYNATRKRWTEKHREEIRTYQREYKRRVRARLRAQKRTRKK